MSKLSKLPLLVTVLASSCAHLAADKSTDEELKRKMVQALGGIEEGVQPVGSNDTEFRVIKCGDGLSSGSAERDATFKARSELARYIEGNKEFTLTTLRGSKVKDSLGNTDADVAIRKFRINCILMTMPRRSQHR